MPRSLQVKYPQQMIQLAPVPVNRELCLGVKAESSINPGQKQHPTLIHLFSIGHSRFRNHETLS